MISSSKMKIDLVVIVLVTLTWKQNWLNCEALTSEKLQAIETMVEHTIKCRNIAGLSLAVVSDGEVVFTRGFGHADIHRQVPATENTRFCIGSLTKAFTSTLIAQILDTTEKEVTWDTPLRNFMSKPVRMYDDLVTEQVNIRDILSHKVGVPPYFVTLLSGYPDGVTREELVRRIQYMPATQPFRTSFLYNNYMYAVAGLVAEQLGGATWEQLVTDNIFRKLRMSRSGFIDEDIKPQDFALPYYSKNQTFHEADVRLTLSVSPAGPAGSITSTAVDMAKWIRYHTQQLSQRKRKPSWSNLSQTYGDQMADPFGGYYLDLKEPTFPVADVGISYGMGWVKSLYRGQDKIFHTGGISTYKSLLWLLPDAGSGVFLATNGPASPGVADGLRTMATYISDILLDETPWINQSAACSFPSPWIPKTRISPNVSYYIDGGNQDVDLSPYVGVYGHSAFGNISFYVGLDDPRLHMEYGRLGEAVLDRKSGHTFLGYWHGPLLFLSYGDNPVPPFVVEFSDFIESRTNSLKINIDPSIKTVFLRDLKLTDSPDSGGEKETSPLHCTSQAGNLLPLSTFVFFCLLLSLF